MKYEKFFELAKEAGIQEAELYISESTSLNFSLFHKEVASYENNNAKNIIARGLINGKFGSASCDTWDLKRCEYLVKEIKENASVIENDDPAIIFEGSEKYHKMNSYSKDLEKVSFEEKLNKMLALEDAIRGGDPRVVEVAEVQYEETVSSITLLNSKGLKLQQKSNYFVAYGVAVAMQNGQTKSDYSIELGTDFNKFDPQELARKIVKKTVDQLGGEPCLSGKYKTVLAPSVVASLLKAYLSHASAEEVQKNSSLFANKLGEKIASSKITIEDMPLVKNPFGRYFDDEGVATYNKPIIKNGVLETYLYNLKTAAKGNTTSTGNGFKMGAKIGINSPFLSLKPGKKNQDELFALVGDGVYITSVSGLHAGLNEQSGDFSLQSTGFLIKDGKLDHGLDIITVSGNLMQLFADVKEVGSDTELSYFGISSESLLIKELGISGK